MGQPGVTQLRASAARQDGEKEKGRAFALPEPRCGGSATLDGLVTYHRLPEALNLEIGGATHFGSPRTEPRLQGGFRVYSGASYRPPAGTAGCQYRAARGTRYQ